MAIERSWNDTPEDPFGNKNSCQGIGKEVFGFAARILDGPGPWSLGPVFRGKTLTAHRLAESDKERSLMHAFDAFTRLYMPRCKSANHSLNHVERHDCPDDCVDPHYTRHQVSTHWRTLLKHLQDGVCEAHLTNDDAASDPNRRSQRSRRRNYFTDSQNLPPDAPSVRGKKS